MSYIDVTTKIETLFFTEFAIAQPDIPIAVMNDGYIAGLANWVRMSIMLGNSNSFALGSDNARHIGIVAIQIFTALGKGTAADIEIADSIFEIYRNRLESAVQYTELIKSVPVERNGWLQSNITTKFRADEHF